MQVYEFEPGNYNDSVITYLIEYNWMYMYYM